MATWLIPALLAVGVGVGVVLQQALNGSLRTSLDSTLWAALANFVIGTLCLAALILALREPLPRAAAIARIPPWLWAGGLLGVVFIALAILLPPRIGAATFFALLVTGQMLASLAFDHFGLFGLAERPADPLRLLGVALLIGGVILIRR